MEDETSRRADTVPVIEEEVVTGTRKVKTGSVRIHKKVERTRRNVDVPVTRDTVEVTRRAINQVITDVPQVREEGDTLIIPVLEEEIVVSKRLMLKEEIHVRRIRTTGTVSKEVSVGREVASVERVDADGNVVPTAPAPVSGAASVISETPSPFLNHEPLLRERDPALRETAPEVPLLRPRKGLLE